MRLSEPRVAPIEPEDWDEQTREILEPMRAMSDDGRVFNIFRTLAHHPDLMRRWLVFGNHVLGKSTLPAREREIAILRIGWLCRAGYEWGQHVVIGKRSGLSDEEIENIARGPQAAGWSRRDAVLLQAVDELHADAMISDDTWKALAEDWDTRQLMDLVFAVGQYNLVSMALNTFGVQLDPGLPGFPEID